MSFECRGCGQRPGTHHAIAGQRMQQSSRRTGEQHDDGAAACCTLTSCLQGRSSCDIQDMVLYRFNHLSQTLKATSTGLFSVNITNAASGAPKYVYKPFLIVPRTTSAAVANQSSDHGHKEDPGYYISKKFDGWENWKSWKDVPDDRIPTSSWRDPDNPIYSHPEYIKQRKQQLFIQRPCGLPMYLRTTHDRYLYYIVLVGVAYCALTAWYGMYQEIYKKYYPNHNLFFFF